MRLESEDSKLLAMYNLSNPILNNNRLSLLDVESSLADEHAVLQLLVAFVSGLYQDS